MIQGRVAKGVRDARMRKLALAITRGCPPRDGSCEARAVHEWVGENIRYTGDVGEIVMEPHGTPEVLDLFQSPLRTIEYGGGDCDDHAALAAALLALNGISPGLVVSSSDGVNDDHIFACAHLPKDGPSVCVPVDTTLGARAFGRKPYFRRARIYPG